MVSQFLNSIINHTVAMFNQILFDEILRKVPDKPEANPGSSVVTGGFQPVVQTMCRLLQIQLL